MSFRRIIRRPETAHNPRDSLTSYVSWFYARHAIGPIAPWSPSLSPSVAPTWTGAGLYNYLHGRANACRLDPSAAVPPCDRAASLPPHGRRRGNRAPACAAPLSQIHSYRCLGRPLARPHQRPPPAPFPRGLHRPPSRAAGLLPHRRLIPNRLRARRPPSDSNSRTAPAAHDY